ncbi:MAG: DUF1214 domain-containing protein [Deltaproteobacteria bacterium]|nr:DUF1214 domain-containing protein [Deltaproteobacteria bacterium]
MAVDEATRRVVEGATWAEFCDTLKSAGDVILHGSRAEDVLDRAEGFRYLSRLTRAALEAFVEHADPLAPVLFRPVHETAKMGADHPDNHYLWARISGEHEYVIRGRRETVHYLGLGTYSGFYGSGGRSSQTGFLEGSELRLGLDGELEIAVSRERRPGNWLPMAPETSSLIVRQTFLDRARERPAELRIERVGGDGRPTPTTAVRIDEGLSAASRLVWGASMMFASWTQDFAERPNELPRFDPERSLGAHGDPNIAYYHGYWSLGPDEVLVVEAKPPECPHWNFQLNNVWMESLDYRYHRIALNKHDAVLRPDGTVRVVVAHDDPDHPNWLRTVGHRHGTMCWRWVRAAEHPQPVTRVAKLADVRAEHAREGR